MSKKISGFSKFTKEEKLNWLITNFFNNNNEVKKTLKQYWNTNEYLQSLHDDFIENTISNFYFPYAIAPNFVINNKDYCVPMVTEESSVVAAASLVAKFWSTRGGFKTTVISTTKVGQVHFKFAGNKQELKKYFTKVKDTLIQDTNTITQNMRKRGGGILNIELRDKTADLENYYQLHVTFETKDSMGANFINTCLEQIATTFTSNTSIFSSLKAEEITVVMSILSNYVPACLVRAEVSCKVEDLYAENAEFYTQKFIDALAIANVEPHRAVTHNKGIMNGIDAVILATGNDFRAIEAGVHAYAAKDGLYKSLTNAKVENGVFSFWIEIPLAIGTVGGLTKLHPLANLSLDMLERPSAPKLMEIIASVGLAQNFAALRALTTTGIQKGHMKMHLGNIIKQLDATPEETTYLLNYFENKPVSHSEVVNQFNKLK